MKQKIFERLRDYFQDIANKLSNEESASKIFANTTDKGITREDILVEFLTKHLPKRCEVIKGGFIFDSLGNQSKQIDIIITNDITLQFKQFAEKEQGGKSFNCIEGSSCAICVKTMLNYKNLLDSLKNIASIPSMPTKAEEKINPVIGDRKLFIDLPYKVIFAFEAVKRIEPIMDAIKKFYKDNLTIQQNRRPDLIIVNNKYFIFHNGPSPYDWNHRLSLNEFYPVKSANVGGISLLLLLTYIQRVANFGSQQILTFEDYINEITRSEKPITPDIYMKEKKKRSNQPQPSQPPSLSQQPTYSP